MQELEDEIEESLDDLEPTPDAAELFEHFRVVADKGQSTWSTRRATAYRRLPMQAW